MKEYFYKRHVAIHNDIKEELVKKIHSTPQLSIDQPNGKFNTDYVVSDMLTREYSNIVDPIVAEHIHYFSKHFNYDGVNVSSLWFQHYPTSGFHPWHVHPRSHFTNIYYIHLPNKSAITNIKSPIDGSLITIDIQEGDILTFPAFLPHESPVSLDEKIIISFNVNIV